MTSALTKTVDWIPAVLHAQSLQGWDAPVGFRAHLTRVANGMMTPERLIYRSADECGQASERLRPRPKRLLARLRSTPSAYEDPRYPVLRNHPDIHAAGPLRDFEGQASATRMLAFLGNLHHPQGTISRLGKITSPDQIDVVHRYLFGDVYDWAGDLQTVRMSRGGFEFAKPEDIEGELQKATVSLVRHYSAEVDPITGTDPEPLADFLARYHWAHPFRDGNGRTAMTVLLALTGPTSLMRVSPDEWFAATTNSLGNVGKPDPGPWVPVVKRILW